MEDASFSSHCTEFDMLKVVTDHINAQETSSSASASASASASGSASVGASASGSEKEIGMMETKDKERRVVVDGTSTTCKGCETSESPCPNSTVQKPGAYNSSSLSTPSKQQGLFVAYVHPAESYYTSNEDSSSTTNANDDDNDHHKDKKTNTGLKATSSKQQNSTATYSLEIGIGVLMNDRRKNNNTAGVVADETYVVPSPPATTLRPAGRVALPPIEPGAFAHGESQGVIVTDDDDDDDDDEETPDFDESPSPPPPPAQALAVASVVMDNSGETAPADLPHAEDFDLEAARTTAKKRQQDIDRFKRSIVWTIVIVIVVIGFLSFITVLLVAHTNGEPSNNNALPNSSASPSQSPGTPIEEYVLNLLPQRTIDAIKENPDSSQAKAYDWLLDDVLLLHKHPTNHQLSDDRLLQRFALATLYFSTSGEDWTFQNNWMDHSVHECRWWYQTSPDQLYFPFSLAREHDNPCEVEDPVQLDDQMEEEDILKDGVYQHMLLMANNLKGSIPPEVYILLKGLRSITLDANPLGSSIPSQLGLATNLEAYSLGATDLTGTIPTQVGALSKLRAILVGYNELTGGIPTELGLLASLEHIAFDQNIFSSTIPTEVGKLSHLRSLFLGGLDAMRGTIPSEIGLLTALQGLDCYQSSLSGTLPTELGLLTKLEWPSFDTNLFTGLIPSQLGQLSLMSLDLFNNFLSGPIPSELGTIPFAPGTEYVGSVYDPYMPRFLTLNNNQLTGQIPSELGLMSIEYLYLFGNNLTGMVPEEVCLINRTEFDCNQNLCGCDCVCDADASDLGQQMEENNKVIYHPVFGYLLSGNGTATTETVCLTCI